jgi:hypothetical protein
LADVPAQRLHFTADFFRAFRKEPALFKPPFDERQLGSIAAGRVPDGM